VQIQITLTSNEKTRRSKHIASTPCFLFLKLIIKTNFPKIRQMHLAPYAGNGYNKQYNVESSLKQKAAGMDRKQG